jgi:adenosylmethionine-8-amino-7-oxononanoate aminotransferase
MSLTQSDLDFDLKHIWHPYTNLEKPTPVFGVESADGVHLNLSNGQRVVDGMSSWWSTIHGYNHPALNRAINEQVSKVSHVMFGGITHKPAVELCQTLIEITHDELDRVFLADSGSVAVEVALKMALQYFYSLGQTNKTKFLTIKNGYHGDTFGAMSVCDPENGMHSMFSQTLAQNIFVSAPNCQSDEDWQESDIAEFEQTICANAGTVAAVVLEPIVQGAGGMRFYCPEFLRRVRRLCDQHNVLLILDEIATGFGRTGTLFAYEQAGICPDILCLGKALTGGYLSLAATLCKAKVAQTISQFEGGNLMHGPTFMGNPLACSVALASLRLLQTSQWKQQVSQIEKVLEQELDVCRAYSSVAEVRVKGAIGVVELTDVVDMHWIQPRLVELGVWIRPFGKLLYMMPPYIIKPEELKQLTNAMRVIAEELSE